MRFCAESLGQESPRGEPQTIWLSRLPREGFPASRAAVWGSSQWVQHHTADIFSTQESLKAHNSDVSGLSRKDQGQVLANAL
jgi:hypothetical protein